MLALMMMLVTAQLFSQTISTLGNNLGITDFIILNSNNQLFGSDYDGSEVYEITKNGTKKAIISNLKSPNGLALDSNDNLYVADATDNKIYKISSAGEQSIFVPNIANPTGLIKEFDSDTIIATSYSFNKLYKIAPDGSYKDFPLDINITGPAGLAYDSDNNLYVAEFGAYNNFGTRKIIKITPENATSVFCNVPGGAIGFIAYGNETIYATSILSHKIYKVNKNGEPVLWLGSSAGNTNGNASEAKFNAPNGITLNQAQDSIFISEYNNGSIRVVSDFLQSTSTKTNKRAFQIEIFPNPSDSGIFYLTVDNPLTKSFQVHILSGDGKLVQTSDYENFKSTIIIDLSKQTSGIYYAEFIDSEGNKRTEKLIKP